MIKVYTQTPNDYPFKDYELPENVAKRKKNYEELLAFHRALMNSQKGEFKYTQDILFNKGRYIEFSTGKDMLRFIAQSAKIKIYYNDMIVCNNDKIEAVVKALNKKGYWAKLHLDWI